MGKGRKWRQRGRRAHAGWSDESGPGIDHDGDEQTYDGFDMNQMQEHRESRRGNYKDEQLAKIVFRSAGAALDVSLPTRDGGYVPCALMDVLVRPGGTHVDVLIAADERRVDRTRMPEWLAGREGAIRAELARALNRKKTPGVTLRVCTGAPVAPNKEEQNEES